MFQEWTPSKQEGSHRGGECNNHQRWGDGVCGKWKFAHSALSPTCSSSNRCWSAAGKTNRSKLRISTNPQPPRLLVPQCQPVAMSCWAMVLVFMWPGRPMIHLKVLFFFSTSEELEISFHLKKNEGFDLEVRIYLKKIFKNLRWGFK